MNAPVRVVVMGVAGSGKTTVGGLLAATLAVPFVDGDDLHDAPAKAKMAAGIPLDDADRAPWLDRIGDRAAAAPGGLVVACSALRGSYRDRLRRRCPGLRFVFLDLPQAQAAARLATRAGHFFAPSLLASQFATLEPPTDALRLDAGLPPATLAAMAAAALRAGP